MKFTFNFNINDFNIKNENFDVNFNDVKGNCVVEIEASEILQLSKHIDLSELLKIKFGESIDLSSFSSLFKFVKSDEKEKTKTNVKRARNGIRRIIVTCDKKNKL